VLDLGLGQRLGAEQESEIAALVRLAGLGSCERDDRVVVRVG
jgi:hypothetical protein